MSYISIHTALSDRLQTVVGLPTLQEENNRVRLGNGDIWSRATLLPAKTNIQTIGPNGFNQLNGLYQVDLFYPSDTGYTEPYNMVDLILASFVAGTVLGQIRIKNSYMISSHDLSRTDKVMPNYFILPVMIEWETYEQRPTIT